MQFHNNMWLEQHIYIFGKNVYTIIPFLDELCVKLVAKVDNIYNHQFDKKIMIAIIWVFKTRSAG